MSTLHPEFIQFADQIASGFPKEYALAYPRRIITPSNNYENPKHYAASLAAILHLGKTNYNTRNAVVAGIDFCAQALVQHQVPTFFIHPEFLRAVVATDLAPDFEFRHLKWPFDAMLFVLPLDVMNELFPVPVPWLAISRIPAGEHPIGTHYRVNFNEDRVAFHYPVFADKTLPSDFGGQYPVSGKVKEYMESKPFLDDTFISGLREDSGLENLTPEQDNAVAVRATTLSVMITLAMIARPEYVEMGPQIRKAKIIPNRPQKSYDALWSPNMVGAKYARKYESERKEGGSSVTRRFWKRRGHMRNQIYGKMKDATGARIPAQLRPHELIWIDPIGE